MQLEDYFEFEKFESKHGPIDRIRLKGHRIDIDQLLQLFKEGLSPERIRQAFPTLTLEEVYASILYYLQHTQEMEDYITRGEQIAEAHYQKWAANPPPVVQRLRLLQAQEQAKQTAP